MNDDIVTIFQNGLKKNPNTVLTDIEAKLENLQKYQDDVLKTIAEKMTALEDFIKEKVPYAENMRGRIARRNTITATKFGNCKCGGGAALSGEKYANLPSGAEDYDCSLKSTSGSGCSIWALRKGYCADGECHTCLAGSLYQQKCTKKADTDSYWKTAPVSTAKESPGMDGSSEELSQSPNEFITSVNNTIDEMRKGCSSFEEACPRTHSSKDKVLVRDIGSLPVEINENKSILRSDSDGNLSTTPALKIKKIYDDIKSAQESFAHRTVRSQKRLSNCITITNTLVERITYLKHTVDEQQTTIDRLFVSTLQPDYKNWMYSNLLAGQDSNIEFDSTIC